MPRTALTIALTLTLLTDIHGAEQPDGWRWQWYDQGAELTRYDLEQSRYGDLRHGYAVLVYVTEPLDPETGLKADDPDRVGVIPGLKLNRTRSFLTGVYPYSVMTSTFQPIAFDALPQVIKVSHSMQEWCGHVWVQLNQRDQGWEVHQFSYFESDGDRHTELARHPTEDGVWTRLRLGPERLPTGDLTLIPSLEASRFAHRALKPEPATASLKRDGDHLIYRIAYADIPRSMEWRIEAAFPWRLESWQEQDRNHASTGTARQRQMWPYWQLNGPDDVVLREQLGLPSRP